MKRRSSYHPGLIHLLNGSTFPSSPVFASALAHGVESRPNDPLRDRERVVKVRLAVQHDGYRRRPRPGSPARWITAADDYTPPDDRNASIRSSEDLPDADRPTSSTTPSSSSSSPCVVSIHDDDIDGINDGDGDGDKEDPAT
jgi:hypothetical protein